jgi:hypothetical protein
MPTGRERSPPATRRRALEFIAWSPSSVSTGSLPIANTIGMEVVAALAASAAGMGLAKSTARA